MPTSLLLGFVGTGFLILTAYRAARAAWRHRDLHHLDILLLTGGVVLLPVLDSAQAALGTRLPIGPIVALALPAVLLRLVHHFRAVPLWLRGAPLVVAVAGAAAFLFFAEGPRPWILDGGISIYVAALQIYAALAFTTEARRSTGVSARRLTFVAMGTWALATVSTLLAIAATLPGADIVGLVVAPALATTMAVCYFLGFVPPRELRARWQRDELARFLQATSDRDPLDRGVRATDDLYRAAMRGVASSAALVALVDNVSGRLVVRASSEPALIDVSAAAGSDLIGQALKEQKPASGTVDGLGPEWAWAVARFGDYVLVAPIASSARVWGVTVVLQRRGSLFPDDDLRLLSQLSRYAGSTLDYAQLVSDARERERRASDRRLRETESRMSLMLDSIKDYALVVLDNAGRVVSWHIGAEQVFGYRAVEIADQPVAPLFELSAAEFAAFIEEAAREGYAAREGACRRRDGSRFVGSSVLRPLAQDPDDLQGFVLVTRDVTERRELEERLRQGQKMEALGRLAGGIAHDFNNLLTAILGYADLLQSELGAADHDRQEQVAEIQRAADRAAGLTRQLLAFSRQQVLQPAVLDLGRIVAELAPMLRRVIGEHIDVNAEPPGPVPPILADRHQVEQIIVNLAVNARDAMPSGGRLTIRTEAVWLDSAATAGEVASGQYVLLEVHDTGVGMDEATRTRIFEPFFTTKAFGRGTGLGLATVYGNVKQMGGTITVASEPEHGTTFRVYFPETRDAAPAPLDPPPTEAPRGDETLLLVEDETAVRQLLANTLERHGYRVLAAARPDEALEMARAHTGPVHLVITDVVMPGGTGPELVRALDVSRPGVPALFISGYADAVFETQGGLPEGGHFLQKPFTPPQLLTRVRQILAAQQSRPGS